MKNDILLTLYKQSQTVFTVDEVALLLPEVAPEYLRKRLAHFAATGRIKKPRKGIYTKDEYNPYELANKLYTPSYISLETVLQQGGVVFQYYETIFMISYLTRTIELENLSIQYRQMKKDALVNKEGIEFKDGYHIASLERAFLDAVYLYKDYFFDNLDALNWDRVHELIPPYESKIFTKRVEEYYQHYQEDHA